MPKRRNPRLAYCEYVLPQPEQSTATQMARRDLMHKVHELHRPMLKELSRDVFPSYVELSQSGFNLDSILWNPNVSPHLALPDGQLKSVLHNWATKFHAEEGWLLDETLRTLRGWCVAPDWRASLRWNPIGTVTPVLVMGEPFCFHREGWEMQLLTWADYARSVHEEFEKKLGEYEASSRKLAESQGLVRAPHKYSPANLEWFVLYQFAGRSSKEIADRSASSENPTAESTVLKGVQTAARLLGWEQVRPSLRKSNRKIQ